MRAGLIAVPAATKKTNKTDDLAAYRDTVLNEGQQHEAVGSVSRVPWGLLTSSDLCNRLPLSCEFLRFGYLLGGLSRATRSRKVAALSRPCIAA